jgi:hypothetical protein
MLHGVVAQEKVIINYFLVERHAYSGDQIKKNEIGAAYNTYWGEERFIHGFDGKT